MATFERHVDLVSDDAGHRAELGADRVGRDRLGGNGPAAGRDRAQEVIEEL